MHPPRANATTVAFLLVFAAGTIWSQVRFKSPQPGDVYREYTHVMVGDEPQVRDPNIDTNKFPYLYAPPIYLDNIDLSGAVRAEAVITYLGGHVSTIGQKWRWNGSDWIDIPLLDASNGIPAGHQGYDYLMLHDITLDVPLSLLHSGSNWFQGTTGTQGDPRYSFGWGQWGWAAIILRVYYGSGLSHATGNISSQTSGGTLSENPTIAATVTGGSAQQIDFLAYYEDYDTDGDGIYLQYHQDYMDVAGSGWGLRNHVGTATGSPWSVTWHTDWVPDQAAGQVKLLARIRDNNGVWYVTPEVTNLTLARNGFSIKLYKPLDMPERCWVKGDVDQGYGYGHQIIHFDIPSSDNLGNATAARYYMRTWNGLNGVEGDQTPYSEYRHLNNWADDKFGADHGYSFDARTIPVSALQSGTNTWHWYNTVAVHHGIEVEWPGPVIAVRYSGSPSNNPPSITLQPLDQTVAEGQTATFTVGATGTGTLSYQWQKNSANISGAIGASYTTPALSVADNNATFRCNVTNNYGSVTSTSAKLTVTTGGGGTGTNVLANGSFEAGTSNWTFYTNGAGSMTTVAPGTDGASAARIAISTAGTNVQLYQSGISLEPGTQYTLSFDAYASAARTISVSLGQHGSPYTNYGLQSKQFALGTSWQKFSITFATSGFSSIVADGRLLFWFADVDAAGDQYTFDHVVLSKAGGGTTTGPSITSQPGNQSVGAGQTATFIVGASGTAPLSYQWQKNSSDISDATNSSYTTPAVSLSDNNATFRCVVKNNYGTATSNNATLTVTTGGGGSGTNVLSNGSFESGTSGWSFYTNGSGSFATTTPGTDGTSAARISIATAGTNVQLSQFNFSLEANTQYTLKFDAYASAGRTIKVSLMKHVSPYTSYGLNGPPFTLGTSWQTFTVTFTTTGFSGTVSDPRLMFWFADADAAGDQYFFDNIVLSKPGGGTSIPPSITTQPSNQTVAVGQTASFSVGATGTAPLSYQWQRNSSNISGATIASYTTPAVTVTDDGATFRCVVTNAYGSVTSNAATLTVTTGGSGGVNLLTNGGFESGTTGWTFYSNGSGGFAAVTPGSNGTYAGRIIISSAGTNVQLYQSGFSLDAATAYTLSFYAYATAARTISVSLGKHVSPYTNYGLASRAVALGTSWQNYSIAFTTSGFSGTVTDPRLMFWFADADAAGDQYNFDNVVLSKSASGSPEILQTGVVTGVVPKVSGISDVFPNPFNPSTNIRYTLLEPATVTLRVYSILGQEIATLFNGAQGPGPYSVVWDGRNINGTPMGSGVYVCRLTGTGEQGSSFVSVKRILLLK